MGERVTVKGRLLNNAIFEARENEQSGNMEFSALIALEEGEEKKVIAARDAALKEKWGDKVPVKLVDWAVRVGDDEDYQNTFGKHFVNAKSRRKPKALKKLKDGTFEKLSPDDDPVLIYAGVYVYASIDVYVYDANKQKKSPPGVTTGLAGVLFWKHGESLGGELNAGEAFGGDDIIVEDEDEEVEV